ncbi:MAG: PAS domain S-box protein [Bacteroidota bacterium]
MEKIKKHSSIESVKKEDNMFLSLFESSINAIILGIPDGTILEANNAAVDMFGYSLDELRNLGRTRIFDHEDPEMIAALKIRESEGKAKGILIGIRKSGERFPCEFSSAIFKTESGESRTSTVLIDITERRNAEAEIALLLDNTEECFVLLNKQLQIISFNKEYKATYEKCFDKIVAKGLPILGFAREERKETLEIIYERVFSGETVDEEVLVLDKDQNSLFFHSRYKPALDSGGSIVGIFITSRNVTDKVNMNLRQEIERRDKEALINSTDDLIWSANKDFVLMAGNTAFLNSQKNHSDHIFKVGDNLLKVNLFSEDDILFWKTLYMRALNGEYFKQEIQSLVSESADVTWFEISLNPIFDKQNVIGVACYGRNITEKKHAQIKLKESFELFEKLTSKIPAAIYQFEIDPSGKMRFPYISSGINKINPYLDIPQLRVDAAPAFSKVHPEDVEKFYRSIETSKTYLSDWDMEYRIILDDKKVSWVKGNSSPEKRADGTIVWYGYLQDITDRKNEEQHLKLLESVITNTNDSIMITEAEPFDEPGPKILYVNEAFTRMTGYTPDEVIGKTPRILQGPKSDKKELKRLSEAIRKWNPCEVTIINYKKNGEEFWINFSLTPVTNENGWFTHWISVERDVTEYKQNELEREQIISELLQNNKDLKQFSYVTSHNLRAPIANLLGLTSLIDHYKVDDPSLKQVLEGIKQSALMFDETVKDLSKVLIIKDQSNVLKEQISLDHVVGKTLKQLGVRTDGKEVTINCDFRNSPFVTFTASYLESVFMNLFTNAFKYRSNKRHLTIDISSENTREYTVITFTDNGIGIDLEKYKDRIFNLYQRFHENSEGKGLGLYLIRSQLEALGSTIDVTSEVDKGTSFILKFRNED